MVLEVRDQTKTWEALLIVTDSFNKLIMNTHCVPATGMRCPVDTNKYKRRAS